MAEFGLLAAMDGIGFLIFFLVAFISWLVNFLGTKPGANPNRPRPAQGQGRGKQLQSEIDRFLEQARELAEKKKQNPNRRGDDEVVVVQMPQVSSRRAPPPSQQRKRTNPQPSRQQPPPQASGRKSISQQSDSVFNKQSPQQSNQGRRPKGNRSGSGQQRPASTAAQSAQVFMAAAATGQLKDPTEGRFMSVGKGDFHAPLSQSTASDRQNETLGHQLSVAEQIAIKMRSPNHVRDAFVMNEVLQRPLAFRRRS